MMGGNNVHRCAVSFTGGGARDGSATNYTCIAQVGNVSKPGFWRLGTRVSRVTPKMSQNFDTMYFNWCQIMSRFRISGIIEVKIFQVKINTFLEFTSNLLRMIIVPFKGGLP